VNTIITILILCIILGLIISIHEFGHFIAAKKSGVYVDEFSIGMGPVLWKHKPKDSETTYSLRLLPIGGFVSMAEKKDPSNRKIKKDQILENKSFLHNLWVFINGIVFNFLLAIVLFFISGLLYGRPISEPIVSSVSEGGAAEKAGLATGDRIIKVNGVNISTLDDFLLEASAKKLEKNYVFTVKKADGTTVEYNLVPEVKRDSKGNEESRIFGIMFSGGTHKKGFGQAIIYGFTGFYENFITIFKILGSLFTGKVSTKSLSGPVGIYSLVDSVKSQGLETLIYLTAYLSINVGIINLFPIPVFDGGRIFILIIEKIIKRKTDEKLENALNLVGFGLMILLMLYVTFNDIIRLVVK